jgi:hypothetical protein
MRIQPCLVWRDGAFSPVLGRPVLGNYRVVAGFGDDACKGNCSSVDDIGAGWESPMSSRVSMPGCADTH